MNTERVVVTLTVEGPDASHLADRICAWAKQVDPDVVVAVRRAQVQHNDGSEA